MGVGNAARDFLLLLNGVLTLGAIKEMLLPENSGQRRLPGAGHVGPQQLFWMTTTETALFLSLSQKSLPASFYPPKNLRHNWLGPHSHIFAPSGSARKAKSTSVTWGPPRPSPSARAPWTRTRCLAYQVFEFCGEAAIVGFFHVHDFCVCAQNVKFSGSESQEKNQPRKSLSGQRTKLD